MCTDVGTAVGRGKDAALGCGGCGGHFFHDTSVWMHSLDRRDRRDRCDTFVPAREDLLLTSNGTKFFEGSSSHFFSLHRRKTHTQPRNNSMSQAYRNSPDPTSDVTPDISVTSRDKELKKLSLLEAFGVAYLGLAVLITLPILLGYFVNWKLGLGVGGFFILTIVCLYLYTTARERAGLIHKCFDMGGWSVAFTTTLILLCNVPFVGQFIYFFVGFPVLVLLMVQLVRGKCKKD